MQLRQQGLQVVLSHSGTPAAAATLSPTDPGQGAPPRLRGPWRHNQEQIMNSNRKLWIGLGVLLAVSFGVLLWVGTEIHRVMPPIPAKVVSDRGEVIYTRADIETGRQVWQSIGGHQLGSIWGHGSYVAPDWSAD